MVADRWDRLEVNFLFLRLSFLLYLFTPRIIPVVILVAPEMPSKAKMPSNAEMPSNAGA
jgi:hypothetical protein